MGMRTAAFVLLGLALAAPLRAADVGVPLSFPGLAMESQVDLPILARKGDVVWESGPSEPLEAAFTAVLLQGSLIGKGLVFEASLSNSMGWGPWVRAEGEVFADGLFWAKAAVAGTPSVRVRLRAVLDGSGPVGAIQFFGIYASGQEQEGLSGSSPVFQPTVLPFQGLSGTVAMPDIQPRSAWGALAAAKPYEPMIPERISVHHAETPRPMTRETAISEIKAIQRFHQGGRGWIDIAYHFIIDGTGQVWEGRPLTVVGAHVKEKNNGNVGIVLLGDFRSTGKQKPNAAQLESLIALSRWLSAAYAIPAGRIQGHRDQEQTSCPGDNLYARLDGVRKAVAAP